MIYEVQYVIRRAVVARFSDAQLLDLDLDDLEVTTRNHAAALVDKAFHPSHHDPVFWTGDEVMEGDTDE